MKNYIRLLLALLLLVGGVTVAGYGAEHKLVAYGFFGGAVAFAGFMLLGVYVMTWEDR